MSKTNSTKNIGILGGTFNPPHLGHISLGCYVLKNFPISSIKFVLSAKPPHKSGQQIVEPALRFSILETALRPYPNLIADRSELDRPTTSWTILTIEQFQKAQPTDSFFFICGSEAFMALQTWHKYQALLNMIGFLVYLRAPEHYQAIMQLSEDESITLHFDPPTLPAKREITLFEAPSETIAISSTDIRNRIRQGQHFEHLLPETIANAIKEKRLYA